MDLENIMLSEVSQIEKDKTIWNHIYAESKNKTNESIYKAETGKENKLWLIKGKGKGG